MDCQVELKKASIKDAPHVFAAWGSNVENFTFLSAPPQSSVTDAENYLAQALAGEQNLCFHIIEKKTANIVGLIKAKVEGHKALVGYVIDKGYWGKGFATQALTIFIPHVKNLSGITRIWATCATNNFASISVLEKCGFVREGILTNWIIYPRQGNNAHDNYSYVLPLKR